MGDEVVVVASESEARAVVAQRIKQQEVKELEKQVCASVAHRIRLPAPSPTKLK